MRALLVIAKKCTAMKYDIVLQRKEHILNSVKIHPDTKGKDGVNGSKLRRINYSEVTTHNS